MTAKYKIGSRVHHDGICLTVTDVAFSDLMNEYSYAVRKTDGTLLPFFLRLAEYELTPCDCKPTTKAAALPAASTLRVTEPLKTQFAEGDQVRVTRTRMLSYVQEVRGEDVMLAGGNWYHVGELTLFRKAPAKDLEPVSLPAPAVVTPKPRLEPLPGKFQRGQWVMTAHGKGRVLGLGAPNLYHVAVGSRHVIAREEYMQAAVPNWTLKPGVPTWKEATAQFNTRMAAFRAKNAAELVRAKADILK